jgi:hypothetical protein
MIFEPERVAAREAGTRVSTMVWPSRANANGFVGQQDSA